MTAPGEGEGTRGEGTQVEGTQGDGTQGDGTQGEGTQGEGTPDRPGRRVEKRRLAAMVSVRFAPAELTALQAHAAHAGLPVSAYLRGLALRDMLGSPPGPAWTPVVDTGDVGAHLRRTSVTSRYVVPSS